MIILSIDDHGLRYGSDGQGSKNIGQAQDLLSFSSPSPKVGLGPSKAWAFVQKSDSGPGIG